MDKTGIPEDNADRQYEDAPKELRFANYIIDVVGYIVFAFLIGILFSLLGLESVLLDINQYALGFFIVMLYFSLFEGLTGRTPGKFITKTKIVMEDGSKPNFDTILGRSLCRLIPFESLSFLLSERGWHDRITKTRVVKDKGRKE